MRQSVSPYEAIGEERLHQMIDLFYEKVAKHPNLSKIFPDDLTETARRQKQFQTQFLGGPQLFTEEHGHPMMRRRHLPFPITPTRAQEWLECMSEAMDEVGLDGELREFYFQRLVITAHHMINTPEEDVT